VSDVRSVRVARADDVPPGRALRVDVDGAPVALTRVGERVYACGAVCGHRGGPLADGKLSGSRLTCPWHGFMYDVRTGACVFPARGEAVRSYPTRVENGDVWIDVPAGGATAAC
jgi:nitrite reductase/ring-hydroxylating ferredoxin subunit